MTIAKKFPNASFKGCSCLPTLVIPLFVGRDKSINCNRRSKQGDKEILLVAKKLQAG